MNCGYLKSNFEIYCHVYAGIGKHIFIILRLGTHWFYIKHAIWMYKYYIHLLRACYRNTLLNLVLYTIDNSYLEMVLGVVLCY